MSNPSKRSWVDRYKELAQAPVDSWTTSYGDLMTILLVFFVMLISASHISAIKFERLKRAFQGATTQDRIALVVETLEQQIDSRGLSGMVRIEEDGNSVKISFHDRLLFDLGKAEVKSEGKLMLSQFATTLAELPTSIRIAVEGYTDDNPIAGTAFQSNWHLSSLRSLSVLEILEAKGVCRENCEVRGYGEHRPALPNRDEEGRPIAENQSENRRVVLRLF